MEDLRREFADLIETDRQAQLDGHWTGTFLEYLQKLKQGAWDRAASSTR